MTETTTKGRTVQTRPAGERNGFQLHEAAGGTVYATRDGVHPLGVAWGPAADRSGEWFAKRNDQAEAVRVADRDAAIAHIAPEEAQTDA